MPASFDVKRTTDQQFMFNLRAENSEVILTSERYTTKQNALNGVAAVRANSQIDARYQRYPSGSMFYFTLRGGNNEVLGTSERYTTALSRDNGIQAVTRTAPIAPVRDLI